MIITVDIDTDRYDILRANILIGLSYNLTPISIRKSPSRKGYHIVWRTHKSAVKNLNFLDTDKEVKDIVRHRLNLCDEYKITENGNKTDILRVVLGDDIYRVIYDIKRRHKLPEQVLFIKSKKFYRYTTVNKAP